MPLYESELLKLISSLTQYSQYLKVSLRPPVCVCRILIMKAPFVLVICEFAEYHTPRNAAGGIVTTRSFECSQLNQAHARATLCHITFNKSSAFYLQLN